MNNQDAIKIKYIFYFMNGKLEIAEYRKDQFALLNGHDDDG